MHTDLKITDIHIITDSEKQLISAWQYPAPYNIYNLPEACTMKTAGTGFYNPDKAKNYYTYYINSTLVAYTNFSLKNDSVTIGIGLHPDFCGKGYGKNILEQACLLCTMLYPGKTLILQVRSWNIRAIKCYEKAGFSFVGQPYELTTPSGKDEFINMKKDI